MNTGTYGYPRKTNQVPLRALREFDEQPLQPFRSPTARWFPRQMSAQMLVRGAQIGSLTCTWSAAVFFVPAAKRN